MFPERLKLARKAKNLTQKQVAEHLGINLEAYQHYEYGFRKPPFDNIVALCLLLEVSSDYLLGLTDDRG